MSRILIRNGWVVSPQQTLKADVLIEGEKIVGITAPGAIQWADAREIDAAESYVIPGVVDAHTHIQLDTGVYKTADNWEIGTRAAAYGGVTTVVDFATQFKGMSFRQALDHRLAECQPAFIDYGLHMMVTDLARDPATAAHDLAELRDLGVPSIKLYTTYRPNYYADDATLLHTFEAMPHDMIALVHCENDAIIADATARLVEDGKTTWRYHGESRPEIAETEAAARVITLLPENKAVYIVHCSAANTCWQVERLREVKHPKKHIYYETCIQYLLMDDKRYQKRGAEKFILQPPLRSDYSPDFLMYRYVHGEIFVLSTDHCDYTLRQKKKKNDFRVTPGGLPGLETLLPLSFTRFTQFVNAPANYVDPHLQHHILNRLVEVLCTNPAKIFGLYPRKGMIQVGSDADLVIYDPRPEITLRAEDLHYIGGYTPYEGMKVQGRVRTTISRGTLLVDEGQFVAQDQLGRGQFLKGSPFKPLDQF